MLININTTKRMNELNYLQDENGQMYVETPMGPHYPDATIRLTKIEAAGGRVIRIRKHHKSLYKGLDVQMEAVPELIDALIKMYGDFYLPKIIR